jgi:pantothenate kinase
VGLKIWLHGSRKYIATHYFSYDQNVSNRFHVLTFLLNYLSQSSDNAYYIKRAGFEYLKCIGYDLSYKLLGSIPCTCVLLYSLTRH